MNADREQLIAAIPDYHDGNNIYAKESLADAILAALPYPADPAPEVVEALQFLIREVRIEARFRELSLALHNAVTIAESALR